jgi:hypothetical protein
MNNEIEIPDHLPDLTKEELKREEDLKAAAKRRDEYSLVRDQQATEDNEAIARRLEKEKEKQDPA